MTPTISRNQTDGVDAESPLLEIHGPIENCSEGNHERLSPIPPVLMFSPFRVERC